MLKKLKKGKIINMVTAESKAKSLSLQTWATRWERQAGTIQLPIFGTRNYHKHTKTERCC